jgi:phosphoglucomutase
VVAVLQRRLWATHSGRSSASVGASAKQTQQPAGLSSRDITASELAGENIDRIIDRAPGDDAPIGGIKVSAASG